MDWQPAPAVRTQQRTLSFLPSEIRTEIVRKSIHLLIALVPLLASFSISYTMFALGAGTLLYTLAEMRRTNGHPVAVISWLTVAASRDRDAGRFVIGPITLALGAMIALFLYPEPAASIAIYSLAFGDGLSSLVGKLFGRRRIPFTGGKTIAGSLACFVSVFVITARITGRIGLAALVSAGATLFEAAPAKDLDNIILPVATGLLATELMRVIS